MTRQQKKAKSSIEQLRLQEDPESKVGMLPDMQDLASPLAADPNHVFDTNGVVANEGQPHDCRLVPTLPPEVAKDIRPTVKCLWLELTDPNRPCDSVSVDYRVGRIRYLEKLMRTEFVSTADLRQHVERYLGSHDGRRLPVPQAIKRARKKLKLSQSQLAELLSLKDHTLISKYESGKRVPTDRVLEWLRKAENVTRKGRVNGNSQTPHFPVTSDGGKEASSSPNLGESETSPKRRDCTPDNDNFPASTQEVL
jgi:transcriptional regulator with XRE-family HTH domain